MKPSRLSLWICITLSAAGSALAGECVLSTFRKPCPGKEAQAFTPYNGKNPTSTNRTADHADACKKIAEKETKIIRIGVLASKTVTAKFEGVEVATVSDTQECKSDSSK